MTRLVVRIALSFGALSCAIGCSATTGSSWVREPEPGFFPSDDAKLGTSAHPVEPLVEPLAPDSTSELAEAPSSRPRLTRTVTLGETLVAYSERGSEPRVADRSNVNVTINNYVTPENDHYDGYYPVPFVREVRHDGGARPSPPMRPSRPGQSWPAPPEHGPAFPFKTAPASPWAPDR